MDILLLALYVVAQVRAAALLMNTRVICIPDSQLKTVLIGAHAVLSIAWMAWSASVLWAAGPVSTLLLEPPRTLGRVALCGWLEASLLFLVVGTVRALWLRVATRASDQPAPRRSVVPLPTRPLPRPLAWLARLDDRGRLEITEHEWRLPRLPRPFDGCRVVHISDLHYSPATAHSLDRVLDEIERLPPDLIVFTGDLVSHPRDLPGLAQPLSRLRAPLGVYAVSGNHDWWTDLAPIARTLHEAGIRLQRNEHAALRRDDSAIYIAGVDDLWSPTHDPARALHGIPQGAFTILLAHNPDEVYQVPPGSVDLLLAGHTHGGQATLPVIGPVVVPCFSAHFAQGLPRARGALLYVNRGLGGDEPPRFRCKPELTRIILRAGENPACVEPRSPQSDP
jgi:predicted MPP superfamily phosphohydrolase